MRRIPTVAYVISGAFCLGLSGASCDYLSKSLPSGSFTPSAVGVSLGFLSLAVYSFVRGFFND